MYHDRAALQIQKDPISGGLWYLYREMDKFYTVKEVSEVLRVGAQTVRDLLREGELVGTRTSKRGRWRISERALDKFIKDNEGASDEWNS
jgi:excisionase family DNA binding protein